MKVQRANIMKLEDLLQKSGGIFSTAQANKVGIRNSSLRYYVDVGKLDQPLRGIYSDPMELEDPYLLWQRKFEKGVYGGETGLYLHGLTTNTPYKMHMYFFQGYHFNTAYRDDIIPHYIKKNKYKSDVQSLESPSGNMIKVYDIERCLIDVWTDSTNRYIAIEGLHEYLRLKNVNHNKLKEMMEKYGSRKHNAELQSALEAIYGE